MRRFKRHSYARRDPLPKDFDRLQSLLSSIQADMKDGRPPTGFDCGVILIELDRFTKRYETMIKEQRETARTHDEFEALARSEFVHGYVWALNPRATPTTEERKAGEEAYDAYLDYEAGQRAARLAEYEARERDKAA